MEYTGQKAEVGVLGPRETGKNGAGGGWERVVGELAHQEEQSIYKDLLMKPTALCSWLVFKKENRKLVE